MKFTFEGVEYRIVFQYERRVRMTRQGPVFRQITSAMIFNLPYRKDLFPVTQGTVTRHYKDQNSKEVARKAALDKALHNLPMTLIASWFAEYAEVAPIQAAMAAKKFRRAAWVAYLNRKNAQGASGPTPQTTESVRVERQQTA